MTTDTKPGTEPDTLTKEDIARWDGYARAALHLSGGQDELAEHVIALTSLALRGLESEWRDIESAPKDGTVIQVFGGVAHWNDGQWVTVSKEDWPGRPIQWDVTKWRPIPEPPQPDAEGLERGNETSPLPQSSEALPRSGDCEEKVGLIVLNKAERQSGLDRVRHAEGLIKQLPPEHSGRNTWLLNYGCSGEAIALRKKRNVAWDAQTKSAKTSSTLADNTSAKPQPDTGGDYLTLIDDLYVAAENVRHLPPVVIRKHLRRAADTIEKLTEERDFWSSCDIGKLRENAALRSRVEKLEEALRPFAKKATETEECCKLYAEADAASKPENWANAFDWDDILRARAALAQEDQSDGH